MSPDRTFTWSYDDAARRVTTTTPLGRATVSLLNPRGLPDTVTEPSAQTTAFTSYDAEGRVLTRTDGAGTTTFTYHANGLLHTVSEGGRTTTRTYDAQNRLSSYSDGEGHTLSYTYWPSGELKTLTYPGNKTVTYTYDDFGRLQTVQDWNNRTTTYTYWENGQLKTIARPNGTLREQSYDAAGQLRFVRETRAGALFAFQELRHDADGRIEYSHLHPMPAAVTLSADTLDHDADNRLNGFNGAAVGVDADGNLTRGPALDGTVPGADNFTYDARNRLTTHGGSSYRYNPDGLRVEVTGTGACTFVVDPNAALSRTLIRTKGGVTTYCIHGLGLLYEVTGTSTSTYHFNQIGSTVVLTDGSGTVTDRWSYAPFGTDFRVAGTSDTPFRFNGEFGCTTEASGLVYMRARYYHPRVMRFLNADPIGFDGGMNWYVAFGNNPISNTDPSGLLTDDQRVEIFNRSVAWGAVGGAFLGGVTGGTGGTILGLPTGPGAGATGYAGAAVGSAGGGVIGAGAGAVAGAIAIGVIDTGVKIGDLIAHMAGDGLPKSNTVQNKQFGDAVKRAERETGGKMSPKNWERLHREASDAAKSGKPYSFNDFVEAAKGYLPAAAVAAGAAAGSPQDAQAAQRSEYRK